MELPYASLENCSTAVDPTSFLDRLRDTMHRQRPVPAQHHGKRLSHVGSLEHAIHVFVRHDAVKAPLQRPYDGPFLVIKRDDKFFSINKNGYYDTVSIDRLSLQLSRSSGVRRRNSHLLYQSHLLLYQSHLLLYTSST